MYPRFFQTSIFENPQIYENIDANMQDNKGKFSNIMRQKR